MSPSGGDYRMRREFDGTLKKCKRVGDGQGRSHQEIWRDREWCTEVAVFLR